jgi:hypothetical protein
MTDTFRAVIRRSFLESGVPRVSREVVGFFPTRKEAEEACNQFAKSQGDAFRAAYDDWVVERVLEQD